VGRLVPYAIGSPGSFAYRVRTRAGIEGFHVHQMRHTFACQWLERGGSLAALQQVLGHASIVTTQRYARLTDEAVMREAARLASSGGNCGT
jgi:integrase